ncbi:MAG: TrkH family potassium uptake protein [Gammaproteobacteria bacterium]
MRVAVIQRVLGLFLVLFTLALIPPSLISIWYRDGELFHFTVSMAVFLITGLLLWLPVRSVRADLRGREVFVIVALFWVALGLLSGLPFMFGPHLTFTDSAFEAVSAFTTTGATVIVGLDDLPKSVLFYRAELQWLGGMGVVVLAVAILPMLGVGGMQLYRAETPGPMKDEKITPRISQSARALWGIYVGLTALCALSFWLAGMSWFDAVAHSFTTLSTGGFSTHDASMGYFNSPAIDLIAPVFMLAGGINFSVHFLVLRGRAPGSYWRDPEVRTFLLVVLALTLVIACMLLFKGRYSTPFEAFRYSFFQVASVITSTGFTTDNFSVWPLFVPVLLMLSSFMGGCAGSTAGGMKVIRMLIISKQAKRDIDGLVHPSRVQPLKLGGRVIPDRVLDAVWGFFSTYVAAFSLIMLTVMATGVDHVTAFSAVTTCINNLGPGLGRVTSNFVTINPVAKWLLVMTMLLGRLEVFTLLVLLSPRFWRG